MSNLFSKEKISDVAISTTLYRALLLMKILLKTPLNIQEIRQILSENKIIGTKVSDDTVRMTIATLKSVGCVFSKPSIKNDFKYKILKSPFVFSLSDSDIDLLKELREQLAPYTSWENLLHINNLYSKLNISMNGSENDFDLSEQGIFVNYDLDIIHKLNEFCGKNIYVNILYNSQGVLKNINVIPLFMKYENESVYLWAYNETYLNYSYLKANRIKKINQVLPDKPIPKLETYKLYLKIKKEAYEYLSVGYNTKILSTENEYYNVEVDYISEFHIIQKILELSSDCEVILPNDIRTKVFEKLKDMMELYKS